jgi:hypothetical protein
MMQEFPITIVATEPDVTSIFVLGLITGWWLSFGMRWFLDQQQRARKRI